MEDGEVNKVMQSGAFVDYRASNPGREDFIPRHLCENFYGAGAPQQIVPSQHIGVRLDPQPDDVVQAAGSTSPKGFA